MTMDIATALSGCDPPPPVESSLAAAVSDVDAKNAHHNATALPAKVDNYGSGGGETTETAISAAAEGGRPGSLGEESKKNNNKELSVQTRSSSREAAAAADDGHAAAAGHGINNGNKRKRTKVRVALLHSARYASVLHRAMEHVHRDRDLLLSSLLRCCGFLVDTPSFFDVVPPPLADRRHLESFHAGHYLDWIEFPPPRRRRRRKIERGSVDGDFGVADDSTRRKDTCASPSFGDPQPYNGEEEEEEDNGDWQRRLDAATDWTSSSSLSSSDLLRLLDVYGLTDDCPLPDSPESRATLWTYCRAVAGASIEAARLLVADRADVAINWGGGRHHAHSDRAGGFCYINDVVLAIRRLLRGERATSADGQRRVLYLDVDIHHPDGVQEAFYDTDEVLTVSLHRHAPGFFPHSSGSSKEKGRHDTPGVGYNVNVAVPPRCSNSDFLSLYRHTLVRLADVYDPHAVVLCVGVDGVKGDTLVDENDRWDLSPECLAECVRITSELCAGKKLEGHDAPTAHGTKGGFYPRGGCKTRKLLLLGGGGYNPSNFARTLLLCTASACEGARPGMLWKELPRDVPRHEFFPRYGPEFELVSKERSGHQSSSNSAAKVSAMNEDGKTEDGRHALFCEGARTVELACLYIDRQRSQSQTRAQGLSLKCWNVDDFDDDWLISATKTKTKGRGRRRKKRC